MIGATTRMPLKVSTIGKAGPYIMVPVDQLADLRRCLDEHEVRHWVQELALSIGNTPPMTIVELGRGGDAEAVQTILDGLS